MSTTEGLIGGLEKLEINGHSADLDCYLLYDNCNGHFLVSKIIEKSNCKLSVGYDRTGVNSMSYSARRIRDSILCLEGDYE